LRWAEVRPRNKRPKTRFSVPLVFNSSKPIYREEKVMELFKKPPKWPEIGFEIGFYSILVHIF